MTFNTSILYSMSNVLNVVAPTFCLKGQVKSKFQFIRRSRVASTPVSKFDCKYNFFNLISFGTLYCAVRISYSS
jgi:hypothetical protein